MGKPNPKNFITRLAWWYARRRWKARKEAQEENSS